MKRSNLKFGSNSLINFSILAFHIFGVWPREHSTPIHTAVGYLFKILCSAGWTIVKCVCMRMLEDRVDLISLESSSRCCATTSLLHIFNVLYNFKNIQKSFNQIRELSYREPRYTQGNINTFSTNSVALYVVFVFSALGLTVAAPCICSISATYLLESVW